MKTMKVTLFFALGCLVAFSGCVTKREKTIQNIKLGIETETTASVKYAAFAQKARVEGHDTIAKLFDAASVAEAIHSSNHATVLKTFKADMDKFKPKFSVSSTLDNLQESLVGETFEVNVMYPMFLKDAKSKKIKKATIESLAWALETELKHVSMFKKALEALNTKTEGKLPYHYFVCPVCGDTFDDLSKVENCDLCGTSKELFLDIK